MILDVYGDSEDLIGKWFKRTGKRNDITLATKFANVRNPDGSLAVKNEPEYIREACAKSLQRLGIDCIDLYYCHRLNGKVPVEDVVGAMAKLVKYVICRGIFRLGLNWCNREGKVKHLGLSECSSESLRRAYKVHPIAAVQIEYSPFTLDIEDPRIALLKTCRELGVATIAYAFSGDEHAVARPLTYCIVIARWAEAS